MAELHLQRKETNVWPWIIGALVVAAVLWYVFMRADTRDTTSARSADSVSQMQPTGTAASPQPGTP